MNPKPDPDDAEAARLRAAHELLDERPSPKVRVAVLRAAGESAAGRSATGSVRAARPRAARRWFAWGPAAAAGATVVVGLLAVGISLHVERERPAENGAELAAPLTAAPSAPPAPAANAQSVAPARDRKDEIKRVVAVPAPPARIPGSAMRLSPTEPASVQPAEPAAAPASTAEAHAPMKVSPPPAEAGAPMQVSPAAAEASAPMQVSPPPSAAARAAVPMAKTLSQDQATVARPATRADQLQRSASPDDWLRRIVELRRAGRDKDADDELARFRVTFPNAKIPDEALR